MRRRIAVVTGVAALGLALLIAAEARAARREATIGNYYYQDDVARDRSRLVVDQGDQIRFTVRESDYPPHSVNVDELGIESPDLLLFDTYTTPPLDRPGSYRLYCRPHQDRGHVTTLVVRARPSASSTTQGTSSTTSAGGATATSTDTTATTGAASSVPSTSGAGQTSPSSSPTLPSGVGRATDRRRPPADPESLAGILGRRPATDAPWTRALRLGAGAGAAMLLVTVGVLAASERRRDRVER